MNNISLHTLFDKKRSIGIKRCTYVHMYIANKGIINFTGSINMHKCLNCVNPGFVGDIYKLYKRKFSGRMPLVTSERALSYQR